MKEKNIQIELNLCKGLVTCTVLYCSWIQIMIESKSKSDDDCSRAQIFFFYDTAQYFLRYINMAEYATSNIRDI